MSREYLCSPTRSATNPVPRLTSHNDTATRTWPSEGLLTTDTKVIPSKESRTRTRLFPDNLCIRPCIPPRQSPCCQWLFLAGLHIIYVIEAHNECTSICGKRTSSTQHTIQLQDSVSL
jgi:hypothetical protein